MVKMGIRNDFVVESNGCCFLCLQQNSSVSSNNLTPVSEHGLIYSLQNLTKFLGIDMKTVFKWAEHMPPELLKRVEQSRLKVELCKDCGCLIENFTKLYLQFEKIQMGLMFSLEIIEGKLRKSDETEEMEPFIMLTDPTANFSSDISEKLDILKALRKETIEKCSSKLHSLSPRVRIPNMTQRTLNKEQTKLKNKRFYSMDCSSLPKPSYANSPASIIKIENIKTEPQPTSPGPDDERDSNSDNADDNGSMDSFTGADLQLVDTKVESHPDNVQSPDPIQHVKRTKGGKKCANEAINYCVEVVPSGSIGVEIPPGLFNKETEKINCPSCPSTFSLPNVYRIHYKTFHLGFRYKCTYNQCKRKFRQKAHCYQHYRIVHKAFRVRCEVCGDHFRGKASLTVHLGLASCHLRLASKKNAVCHCPICGKGFTMRCNMNRHIRKFHHQHV